MILQRIYVDIYQKPVFIILGDIVHIGGILWEQILDHWVNVIGAAVPLL